MSDDIHIEKIKELAKQFRIAIESLDKNKLPLTLHKFPQGSCGDTCEMLGAYFIDKGLGQFSYIRAERGYGHSNETHGWLKQHNLIVDITADQFNEGIEKIFVLENNEWHNKTWKKIDSIVADFRNDPDTKKRLYNYYQTISSKANSTK